MSASRPTYRRLFWPLLFAGTTALASSGCEIALIIAATTADDDGYECYDACECYGDCWTDDDGTQPPTAVPPVIGINIADWPPIGPSGEVEVTASVDSGSLSSVEFDFRHTARKSVSGVYVTVAARGDELGEGFGTLGVEANTVGGAGARKEVSNLLVDLTPPEAYVDDHVLPAQGASLSFWIADAWVVSSYELTIDDDVFTETLEPGYPETLGVEWDYSLVTIPVEQIDPGVHAGTLLVRDAAGNEATFDFPVTIDGIPPTASLSEPQDGATVSGSFPVTFTGLDELPGDVALELRVGGALVATGIGPTATVVLDAAEFPAGPIDIVVLAVDEAGNESAPSTRTVTIAHD